MTGIYLVLSNNQYGVIAKYHSSSGMMTFIFCGASCLSGYLVRAILFNGLESKNHKLILISLHWIQSKSKPRKTYTTYDSKTSINNTTGLLIIIFCLLIRYLNTDFRFRRRVKPEWDAIFARKISQYEHSSLDCPGTLEEYVTRISVMSDLWQVYMYTHMITTISLLLTNISFS